MNISNRPKKGFTHLLAQPNFIIQCVRSLIYIIFGFFILMVPSILSDNLLLKYLFCGGSLLYGIFRMWRVYKLFLQEQNEKL